MIVWRRSQRNTSQFIEKKLRLAEENKKDKLFGDLHVLTHFIITMEENFGSQNKNKQICFSVNAEFERIFAFQSISHS